MGALPLYSHRASSDTDSLTIHPHAQPRIPVPHPSALTVLGASTINHKLLYQNPAPPPPGAAEPLLEPAAVLEPGVPRGELPAARAAHPLLAALGPSDGRSVKLGVCGRALGRRDELAGTSLLRNTHPHRITIGP